MNKLLLIFLLLGATTLEAGWPCRGCRRYMDPTEANYDCIPYGYVDNINYPDTYDLPLNSQFNYCPPCSYNRNNYQYFQNCLYFSVQKNRLRQ